MAFDRSGVKGLPEGSNVQVINLDISSGLGAPISEAELRIDLI